MNTNQKITLNGHQLKAALEYVNPDGAADQDQLDSALCIQWAEPTTDGDVDLAGYRAWFAEYPDEGSILLPAERDKNQSSVSSVLHEVAAERSRQDRKWGGPHHDDQHAFTDFREFIVSRLDLAGLQRVDQLSERRRLLVQVAALSVAAIDHVDRAVAIATAQGADGQQ